MDATNGEILGMASYPQFDPSVFIGGISTDLWNEFNADDGSRPLIDRAIAGQYVSASTIKPLGALAGMEYGVYSSSRSTDCTGYWTGWASLTVSGAGSIPVMVLRIFSKVLPIRATRFLRCR